MIVFIMGTTAEAIKVAPIARRLSAKGIRYETWLTCQHTEALVRILPELGFAAVDRIIANGHRGEPLKKSSDVLIWLGTVTKWILKNTKSLRATLPENTVIVVHGDTLTTVIGAYLAKRLGVASAHVEAGLRSGNWRHPFPEELDRRLVGRLATIHYAPSAEAAANLSRKRNVLDTHGNTIIDAVLDRGDDARKEAEPYGLVLLHRYEFISNPTLVEKTISTLATRSRYPLKVMIDAFSGHGLQATLAKHGTDKLNPQPKLRHQQFVGTLRGAEFIVTDSGGIQAEAALLGIPTLVHRMTTEQSEGINENIVLSQWSIETLEEFLDDYDSYRRPPLIPERSPSDIIVEDLVSRGYAR